VTVQNVPPYIHYTHLASKRLLHSADDVNAAADAFKKCRAILPSDQVDLASRGIDQIEVLTEFDTVIRRFATSIPIEGITEQAGAMDRAAGVFSDLQRAQMRSPTG